ncbi:hypothetical protein BSLG_010626 [Batrachochytrium salamandrivorans]|nr:hypothetical protein BSLG_010626 [Batrachochytrium salamandrivorans]
MDGNTPPIFITFDSVVSGGDYDTNNRTVIVAVTLFLCIVVLYILREVFGPMLVARWTSKEQVQKDALDHKLNAERFTRNFHEILKSFVNLSFSYRDIAKNPSKLIPHFFLILWIISIIVIQNAIGTFTSGSTTPVPIIKAPQTQIGLILFFISVNGYLIDRILSYYKDRTDNRKKILVLHHANGIPHPPSAFVATNGSPDEAPSKEPSIPSVSDSFDPSSDEMVQSSAPSSIPDSSVRGVRSVRSVRGPRPLAPLQNRPVVVLNEDRSGIPEATLSAANNIDAFKAPTNQGHGSDESDLFDHSFRYRRRIKHISPQFKRIDFTFANCVEITVLGTEFVQLASFPLRDLLRSVPFQQSMLTAEGTGSALFVQTIRQIVSTLSMGLPTINTRFLTTVQFAISWWMLIFGLSLAIIFTGLYHLLRIEKFEDMVSSATLRRVRQIISGTWDRERQCLPIHDGNPSLQAWYSLTGFMIGFLLLTICRTAQEPIPRDGTIQYTSRSELLFKNAAVIILLIYVLIPSETTTIRGILAVFIMAAMVAYSILIGSSYTRVINVARTISFMCVMWMALVVVYYTSSSQNDLLYQTGSGVFTSIITGWVIISLLYTFSYLIFIRKMQKDTQVPRLPLSAEENRDRMPLSYPVVPPGNHYRKPSDTSVLVPLSAVETTPNLNLVSSQPGTHELFPVSTLAEQHPSPISSNSPRLSRLEVRPLGPRQISNVLLKPSP